MILIESEWKNKFEMSLFPSNFNLLKQGYLALPLRILDFDFSDLIITKSKLFKICVTLNSPWEIDNENSLFITEASSPW